MEHYCYIHNRSMEFVKVCGGWNFECPDCRKEGRYDVITSDHTLSKEELAKLQKEIKHGSADIFSNS